MMLLAGAMNLDYFVECLEPSRSFPQCFAQAVSMAM